MVPDDQGYWRVRARLSLGEYKFRYLSDDAWFTDYAAFGVKEVQYGLDSVLCVPSQAGRTVA